MFRNKYQTRKLVLHVSIVISSLIDAILSALGAVNMTAADVIPTLNRRITIKGARQPNACCKSIAQQCIR